MQIAAVGLIALGTLGTIGSILYFAALPETVQLVPLIVCVIFFGGLEAAGALLLARHRR